MIKSTRILASVAATLIATFWAVNAQSATITLAFDGFANGSETGNIYGVRNVGVHAGQFQFNVIDGGGAYWDPTLQAFCIDVQTNLVTTGSVQYDLVAASSVLNGDQLSLLGQLYDNHGASLGNRTADAAFQLAIWEIMYDFGGALNLTGGNFHSSAFTNGARSAAQALLAGLSVIDGYVSGYELLVLDPNAPVKNQTLLMARQVPEPGTLALLGAALLAMALIRRRRPGAGVGPRDSHLSL